MGKFELRLLGSFELRGANAQPISLPTRKAEAVVALLASRPGQLIERDRLCGLLWPDVRDTQALHSLRQVLVEVRKAFLEALRSNARSVAIAGDCVQVDVVQLEQLLALGTTESLMQAASLYRGDLLESLVLREEPFEQWLSVERERLRAAMTRGLSRLVDLHSEAGAISEAIEACSKLLQLDPFREHAHRAFMRLQLRQGHRASAISHYRKLVRTLGSELGTGPDPETLRLHAEIENSSPRVLPARRHESEPALTVAVASQVPELGEPMILRRVELAHLQAARAMGACLVLGEAGVGKTHLCERFAADVDRETRVLRARCFESEQALPFALWGNLLSGAEVASDAGLLASLSEAQRMELARLLPEIETDAQSHQSEGTGPMFRALEIVLRRLSERTPLTLIVEDLHWADAMSLRALCHLTRRGAAVWVGTARPEDIDAGSFLHVAIAELEAEQRLVQIGLAPLSQADSQQLALLWASHLRLPVAHATWAEQIWSISEGNALVIVESARASIQQVSGAELQNLSVPERVRALIRRRVQRVKPAARELLSFASVFGRELDLRLASELLEPAPLAAAAEELVQSRLMRAHGDRLVFVHDRVRETLWADLLPARRRVFHDQIARALASQPGPPSAATLGRIGYHHSNAGNAPEAVTFLVRFAEQAQRGHALTEALAALEQALGHCDALDAAARALAVVEIAIRRAFCLAFMGRSAELVRVLERYVPELDAVGRDDLCATYHFWWAFGLNLAGELEASERHARQSLAHATACGDLRCVGFAHGILAYLCAVRGLWAEGVDHGEQAIALVPDDAAVPEAPVLAAINTHLNYLWLGDWQKALASAQLAAARAQHADSSRGRALAAIAEGSVHLQIERWQAAIDAAERAIETSNSPLTLVHARWLLARGRIGQRQPEVAVALLERILEELAGHDMHSLIAPVTTTLAEGLLGVGKPDSAVRLAQAVARRLRDGRAPLIEGCALRVLGRAQARLGELASAREQLARARSIFERIDAPFERARTLEAQAEIEGAVSRGGTALACLERAQALYVAQQADVPAQRMAAQLQALTVA